MDRKVPKHESRIDARRPAGAPLSVPSVLLTVAIFACRADCQSGKDEEEPRLRKTKNLHFHAASLFIRAYWCQFVGLPGKKTLCPRIARIDTNSVLLEHESTLINANAFLSAKP